MKAAISKLWSTDLSGEFNTLRNKLGHLVAQKYDVHKDVENSEIQPGKKRKREVEWWFERVDEKEAELKRIEGQLVKQGSSSELKNQITKETNEVEELIHQGKSFSTVVLDDHSSTRLEMVVTNLVGPDGANNVEMILEWLKNDEVFAIGVHGMGGVGKTTLLKKIHNALLQDSDIIGQLYWVTASQDCSLQKLQIAIGTRLGLNDLGNKDDEERRSLIFHRLSALKNTVVIIDDMWNHFPTDQVGILLKSRGCKIVITTRSYDVCRKMGCQKVIKVSPLSEKDAWSLFVENSGEVPYTLVPTATRIVEECGGLPLALITMGCCMRDVSDVCQWKNALYELKKPTSKEDDMEERVFKVLKYSYNGLADEKLQHCFLSGVLFPEDKEIERDRLIDLWIMEGLLDDTESWENKVNKGHAILNRLESSNLLESTLMADKERCVRMHDLIRDMAMIITQHHPRYMAKAGLQLIKVPEEKDWTSDLVKVSLRNSGIEELPCSLSPKTLKLRVLILSDNYELKQIPESFFLHMEALKVLDLSRTGIRRLPQSVSDLVNLRGLLLEACMELEYVPSVEKLTKLMVLHLPGNRHIKEAPEGMEKLMKCLEKLPYCYWSASDLPRFNSLLPSRQLCSYKFFIGGIQSPIPVYDRTWGDYGKAVIMSRGELEQIEIAPVLSRTWGDYGKAVIMSGGEFEQIEIAPVLSSTIQMLKIDSCSLGEAIPFLREATELTELVIRHCTGLVYLSLAPPESSSLKFLRLESLPNLRSCSSYSQLQELVIDKCPRIKVLFPSMSICLPYLEKIFVQNCEEVVGIFESGRKFVALPKLRELRLKNLPKLSSTYSMQLHLCTSLEKITIVKCPMLEGIFTSPLGETISEEVTNRIDVTDPYDIVVFPNLSSLCLRYLPKLGSIYSKHESIIAPPTGVTKPILDLPSLEELKLYGLPSLSSIHLMGARLSTSIKVIRIDYCPKLEGIFTSPLGDTIPKEVTNRSNVTDPYDIMVLPNLEDLTLRALPKLGGIYLKHESIIASPTGDPKPILDLPSLKELRLHSLPNLRSIYSMRLHLSTSLELISIEDCPMLEGIFTSPLGETISEEVTNRIDVADPYDIVVFPNLSSLYLRDLPKLGSIYSKHESRIAPPTGVTKPIIDLPFLTYLELEGLPNLRSIYSMRLHLSTSLEKIHIEDCPKLEGIFITPIGDAKPILALPELTDLVLYGLQNLSSVYKGLLMCSPLISTSIHECPLLKWLSLSKQLICDCSPSTVASFPTESENQEWWNLLHRDFPEEAICLSNFINQARRSSPTSQDYFNDEYQNLNDDDVDDKATWGRGLSLSSS